MTSLLWNSRKNRMRARLARNPLALALVQRVKCLFGRNHDVWYEPGHEAEFCQLMDTHGVFPARGHRLRNRICVMAAKGTATYEAAGQAASHFQGTVDLLDPLSDDWSFADLRRRYDGLLYRNMITTNLQRTISNEHIEAFRLSGLPVWPNRVENYLYEAKRQTAHFCQIHAIPHPPTQVVYTLAAALQHARTRVYPCILKTNLGASSSGVFLVSTAGEAVKAVNYIFRKGLVRRGAAWQEVDTGYVIFQDFIPNVREYRIIQIGESWFGHEKKGAEGSLFYSGSGEKSWDIPPSAAFDFCHAISAAHGIQVMSYDVFQDASGRLLLNEAQTWFGSYNVSQMYKDGVPGRMIVRNASWVFEPGCFNYQRSMNLRLSTFDEYITEQKGFAKKRDE